MMVVMMVISAITVIMVVIITVHIKVIRTAGQYGMIILIGDFDPVCFADIFVAGKHFFRLAEQCFSAEEKAPGQLFGDIKVMFKLLDHIIQCFRKCIVPVVAGKTVGRRKITDLDFAVHPVSHCTGEGVPVFKIMGFIKVCHIINADRGFLAGIAGHQRRIIRVVRRKIIHQLFTPQQEIIVIDHIQFGRKVFEPYSCMIFRIRHFHFRWEDFLRNKRHSTMAGNQNALTDFKIVRCDQKGLAGKKFRAAAKGVFPISEKSLICIQHPQDPVFQHGIGGGSGQMTDHIPQRKTACTAHPGCINRRFQLADTEFLFCILHAYNSCILDSFSKRYFRR